jgi:hypothetical protein
VVGERQPARGPGAISFTNSAASSWTPTPQAQRAREHLILDAHLLDPRARDRSAQGIAGRWSRSRKTVNNVLAVLGELLHYARELALVRHTFCSQLALRGAPARVIQSS